MDREGLEAAEDRLRSLEEQLAQREDQYLRALADLDNYRKRAEREKEEAEKRAKKTVLLDVLDVADTLELAARHEGEAPSPLQEGVRAIHQQLVDILRKNGARPFDPVGKPFDPNYHEAVGVMESEFFPPGVVGLEIKKGYLLEGELLRPSRVHVVKES
jgi:molecular chaperone GrpE